jgi:DNA polymerase
VTAPPNPAPPPTRQQAAAALRWLAEAGADTLVADKAGSWLEGPAPLAGAQRKASAPAAAPPAEASRSVGQRETTPKASPPLAARTLEELRAEAETLPLSVRRPNAPLVFSDGNPNSGLMVIGEAPGAEEERQRRPFVGPAGQLLDRMLAAIGLDRTGVYITNLSLWRPGANRVPNLQEAAELLPLLHRHIALVNPRLILAVGGASAKALLDTPSGIMRLRGRWQEIEVEGAGYPLLATFHPAYLLRSPEQKRFAWADLLAFQARAASLRD